MNHTATHARWRVLPVHLVAKLFGVLIKVEGMPFGSNRTHLANQPRREDVVGDPAVDQRSEPVIHGVDGIPVNCPKNERPAGTEIPASLGAHIDKAVEIEMKSRLRRRNLRL